MKDIPTEKYVRILFQDEARFGRISDHRRCWAPLPIRPIVGRQVIREYLYAFMAVCPFDGYSASLILPWSDAYTMSVFLSHTATTFENDYCIMFLDGAAWHRALDLKIPQNIRIEFLPSYSPELNPVEHIWEYLRENYFGNIALPDLDAVENRLCNGLRNIIFNPDLVKSLTNFSWMNTLCMTLN